MSEVSSVKTYYYLGASILLAFATWGALTIFSMHALGDFAVFDPEELKKLREVAGRKAIFWLAVSVALLVLSLVFAFKLTRQSFYLAMPAVVLHVTCFIFSNEMAVFLWRYSP